MYVIFLYAAASPLLWYLLKNRWAAIGLILAMVWLAAWSEVSELSWVRTVADYGLMPNILRYTPAYVIGAYLAVHCSREPDYKDLGIAFVPILLGLLLQDSFSDICYRSIMVSLPVMLLYFWPLEKAPDPNGIVRLSFLMYAVHAPIDGSLQWRVKELLERFMPCACLADLLCRFTCLAASLLAAWLIHRVLTRFCPKALDVLTGGRA